MINMIDHNNNNITLDEAIAHYEAIESCARVGGNTCPIHGKLAWYLRRLKRYEEAIENGELQWVNLLEKPHDVKHGVWKKVNEKYPRYVCTSCEHLFNNKGYKYCPNCGADMRGKNNGKE